ncbi:MAG: MaoC family dehydratase [Desulfovibrionaceae bacterium]
MNRYTLADMRVGLAHSFEVTVTEAMLDAFCGLSGDVNPLHTDADEARRRGFPDRVAYGMLTASFYSTLVGVHLPGERALLHGVDAAFTGPVHPGDTLTVRGEVSYVNEAYGQIEIKARVVNQHGKTVSRAKIKAGVHDG